jgi:hypothetical protein
MPSLWANHDIAVPPFPVLHSTDWESHGTTPFSEFPAHNRGAYSSHILASATWIQRICERVDVTFDHSAGSALNVSATDRGGSLLTPYTRLATIGNTELTTLEIDVAYNGAQLASESLWEVENWAINAQGASNILNDGKDGLFRYVCL